MQYLLLSLLAMWLLHQLKRRIAAPSSPARQAGAMTRDTALEVLGLENNASKDEIQQAYQTLLKRLHPDTGGSDYLTQQLIEAKRVLDHD